MDGCMVIAVQIYDNSNYTVWRHCLDEKVCKMRVANMLFCFGEIVEKIQNFDSVQARIWQKGY